MTDDRENCVECGKLIGTNPSCQNCRSSMTDPLKIFVEKLSNWPKKEISPVTPRVETLAINALNDREKVKEQLFYDLYKSGESKLMAPFERQDVVDCVAAAYCTPENGTKAVDTVLCGAICDNVIKMLYEKIQ